MTSFGLGDHLVSENDPHLAFGGVAGNRLEAGLFGCLGIGTLDETLEPAHEEQQSDYPERPQDQNRKEEQLIGSHTQ
jgi:hypothetical protein